MPIANTVEATIVVNFEDRFTGPSQKAFEQFRKHAESIFRAVCFSEVAAFEKLKAAQQEVLKFNSGPAEQSLKFWETLKEFLGGVLASLNLLGLNWQLVVERISNSFSFLRDHFLKALRPLLQALKNLRLALPLITAGFLALVPLLAPAAIAFAKVAAAVGLLYLAWKAFEAIKKLLLEVKLKDEATARAVLLRQQLEGTFRDPIVQEIQVLRRNFDGPAGPFSGAGNPVLDDGLITLRRTAPLSSPFSNPLGLDLEPQFPTPSFASGIRFVPRDMLARIHKGETVLPKSQAEQFRNGRMGGISVDNITINMNGGSGANRNEARRFARMIRQELQRTDERTTP